MINPYPFYCLDYIVFFLFLPFVVVVVVVVVFFFGGGMGLGDISVFC